jgi:hypothetical protein
VVPTVWIMMSRLLHWGTACTTVGIRGHKSEKL